MSQFKEMIKFVLENGELKSDRTGTGTISVLGGQWRYNLKEYFPLFTEKRTWFRGVAEELLWFLDAYDGLDEFKIKNTGQMWIQYLLSKDVHIWDEWVKNADILKDIATETCIDFNLGCLGPIYGAQWLNWNEDGINQLEELLKNLKNKPFDRGHILTAWNVNKLNEMALRPCHTFAQFYVREKNDKMHLSCHLYQRSADLLLGVPFNVASYSLLTNMIANILDYEVDELVHSFGDLHIYNNHIEGAKELLNRETLAYPILKIKRKLKNIQDFRYEDFELIGYNHSGKLDLPVSV